MNGNFVEGCYRRWRVQKIGGTVDGPTAECRFCGIEGGGKYSNRR